MKRLMDVAAVIRSKNAGAYEITFDIIFDDSGLYERVKATGIIRAELFAQLYGVRPEEVSCTAYDPALAFKGTIPRRVSAGDPDDCDVYGAQQHVPLLTVEIPID